MGEMELPSSLKHPFHPSHTLTLSTSEIYSCNSCHKYFSNAPSFKCRQCDFFMDVDCAMMDPITFPEVDQKNIIQHFSHQHPMPLVEMDDKDEIKCFGCQSTLSLGDRVHGCTKCKYFLHKSCAELPQKIRRSFHRDHDLTLGFCKGLTSCKICYNWFNFGYACHHCDLLQLCVKCSTLGSTIKYKEHEHLICFVEKINTQIVDHECDGYDFYCKRPIVSKSSEVDLSSSSILRCLDCNFKVHLLCGPLPSTIKHESHIHHLTLVDSHIEDDAKEYYCDVCESKREPRIRVYCCKPCSYIAHVHCVTSEISEVLMGDLRDVEFKMIGQDIWKLPQERDINTTGIVEAEQSLLTLKYLINKLSDEEEEILKGYYIWDGTSSKISGTLTKYGQDLTAEIDLTDEDINMVLSFSNFSSEDFQEFVFQLARYCLTGNKLELKPSDLALKIVNVNGYNIPHTLVPALKTLLHKYRDVSSGCKEGMMLKSFTYFILCQVLKGMSITKVVDITKQTLQEWYFHLRFVKNRSFKIGFALAHLKRLIHAFLGTQLNRLRNDEISQKISQKISMLQLEIEKLQHETQEENSKLQKCKEYGRYSAKSKLMEDCLKEGLELKWKDASEGLFTYQEGSPSQIFENWSCIEEDPVAYVEVEIVEAFYKDPSDLYGLVNPYVIGQLGSYRFQTRIIEKKVSPKWQEEFKIPIFTWEKPNAIAIEVRDKNRFVDNILGDCSVNINSGLRDGQRHDMWLPIQRGMLNLVVTVLEENEKQV